MIKDNSTGLVRNCRARFFLSLRYLAVVCLFYPAVLWGQIGGQAHFSSLHLPFGSRQAALGGINISAYDKDVSMFTANPALLDDSVNLDLSLHYTAYHAGIKQSGLAFGKQMGRWGNWALGIQYLDYGNFERYDVSGKYLGNFKAKDFFLAAAHSRKVRHFRIGATLKLAGTAVETYRNTALFIDIGGVFSHPTSDFTLALAFKNLGFLLSPAQQTFEMPLDVQLGMSFKPHRMPLRVSITVHHLHRFDIAYQDPKQSTKTNIFGQKTTQKVSFADKLSQHFVIGGEFVVSKHLNLRFGYNFLQRRALGFKARRSLTGFSFGAMLRLGKFEFAYANSTALLRQTAHTVSIRRKLAFGSK